MAMDWYAPHPAQDLHDSALHTGQPEPGCPESRPESHALKVVLKMVLQDLHTLRITLDASTTDPSDLLFEVLGSMP